MAKIQVELEEMFEQDDAMAEVEGDEKRAKKFKMWTGWFLQLCLFHHPERLKHVRELSLKDSRKPRSYCEVVICEI